MNDLTSAPPTIDRTIVARDLERLAELLAPAVEARLEALASLTWQPAPFLPTVPLGAILHNRLKGYPRPMISSSLSRILELSDDELVALVDVIGRELGAWRGAWPPLESEELAPAAAAFHRLTEELSE